MRGVLRFLKRTILTIIGLVAGFVALAFIIIAPPPYPYFDWEPYFDQAYAEDGCEGVERFVMMSGSRFNAPNVRLAQMFKNGECSPNLLRDSDPDFTIQHHQPNREPRNNWEAHVAHYFWTFENRTQRTIRAFDWITEILDTPSRRNMWPSMIWFQIRCSSENELPLEIYIFRQRVAEYYDESLRLSAWEKHFQSCGHQIQQMAKNFESTEVAPPADRKGLTLNGVMARWVWQGSMYFNSNELRLTSLNWELNGTALRNPIVHENAWCPTNWDDLGIEYQAAADHYARYTLLNTISNALYDNASFDDRWLWQEAIGNLHRSGRLLPQSDRWAYYWYRRAEEAGSPHTQLPSQVALNADEKTVIDDLISSGNFPENPPLAITYELRRHYQHVLERREQGVESNSAIPFPDHWLTDEDRQVAAALLEAGEIQEWPSEWEPSEEVPEIRWVDCETGEPVDTYR